MLDSLSKQLLSQIRLGLVDQLFFFHFCLEWRFCVNVALSPTNKVALQHISSLTDPLLPVVAASGHKNAVLELHWTTDGEKLLSASPDKSVRAWDAATGAQVKKMGEHEAFINSCCPLRRAPPLLASGADDCSAKVCLHACCHQMRVSLTDPC